MGLKYQKFQNGDKVVFSGKKNPEVFYYVGLNPLNPELSFLCKNNEELVVIHTEVLNVNYEHYNSLKSNMGELIDLVGTDTTINNDDRLKRSLEVLERLKGLKRLLINDST